MTRNDNNIIMEDARVVFRNFAGKEGMYNREGDRNFCVILDEELAQALLEDGWNIKRLKPREEDDNPNGTPYLQVSVGYKGRPPTVAMISSRGRIDLTEDEVEVLDWVDIANVDLIIRPYNWTVNGNSGIKAYLKTMVMTIEEDYLQLKYNDVEYAKAVDGPARLELTGPHAENPPWETEDVVEGEIVE